MVIQLFRVFGGISSSPDTIWPLSGFRLCWNVLAGSPRPKLFINGDPGGFLIGAQPQFCRAWPNQQEITVKGAHFLQEDAPAEVGEAIARFVAKILAGQIS